MKRAFHLIILSFVLATTILSFPSCSKEKEVTFRIIHTSDIHGNFLAWDFLADSAGDGSMSRLFAFMKEVRTEDKQALLFDGGDVLQGSPLTYHSNFIDTLAPNIAALTMNYLKYDLAVPGNHDIEAGHKVYDKWFAESKFPFICANMIDTKTGEPYLKPYKIFERDGTRLLVIGFITPAIPEWVPEPMWSGLRFDDIVGSAKDWLPKVIATEKPDVIVGLLHSGLRNDNPAILENAAETLAKEVPGFDALLIGHDHRASISRVANGQGDSVLILDPANALRLASDLTITVRKRDGKVISKHVDGKIVDLDAYKPDETFDKEFVDVVRRIREYTSRRIGVVSEALDARRALFESSSFMNLIHTVQLRTGQADISFAAPTAPNTVIKAGDLHVRDLFRLYPYENLLYTIRLTGKQIKDYLEYSYAKWTNQMGSADDHILLFRPDFKLEDKYKTQTPFFNYSSAAGIDYIVDVSKAAGKRVTILQLSDGRPFDEATEYHVAMNSYRAGGGGNILTSGAGLSKEEIKARTISISGHDIRYLLMQHIVTVGIIPANTMHNWRFIPQAWAYPAMERDYKLIFSQD